MIAMVFSPLTYFNGNIFIPVCPKEVIPLSGSGKISSPNHPMSNYAMSTNCTWKITGSASQKIKFALTDFALSPCAADCNSDSCSYVEFYDGGLCNFVSLWKNLLVLIYCKLHSKSCDYLYKLYEKIMYNIHQKIRDSFSEAKRAHQVQK